MVRVETTYEGDLRCRSTHAPSRAEILTDAPTDNHGLGEGFSPTDLVATGLVSCMVTVMGIYAKGKSIDLSGLKASVEKEMSSDLPRRIARLGIVLEMPLPSGHPEGTKLVEVAMTCPVHESIHPEIEVDLTWIWQD